jgi:serine/threonine protein kinase
LTGTGGGAETARHHVGRPFDPRDGKHIATVHDVVETGGIQCIVMEFVAGRPLSALIRAGLDLDETLRIAIAIADGLARAHAAGVVHRDLKPANVVVSDDGVPKVLDFGIAKRVEEPAGAGAQDPTQTEDTCVVPRRPTSGLGGTPGYMAPEQIVGGTVDARSDIFSFGALLYEMITGRRAFAGATVADTLGAVLALQPVAPRQLVPEMTAELEHATLRCLRKEPERRFQSIADVKVVLQDIAEARATPTDVSASCAILVLQRRSLRLLRFRCTLRKRIHGERVSAPASPRDEPSPRDRCLLAFHTIDLPSFRYY